MFVVAEGAVTIIFLQTDREGGEVRLIGGGGMQGKDERSWDYLYMTGAL